MDLVSTAIDLGTGLAAAGTSVEAQVNAALPIALPIAGALLAVTIGWKFFKRFVRG